MRKLTSLIIILFGLYAGYWFIASSAVERGLAAWLQARQAEGWLVEYSDLNTRGFPNRLDTRISDLELVDTASGLAWTAPFFEILALSYRPNHIIAVWPNEQTISTPFEKIAVTNDKMDASAVFEAGTALTLDRADLELQNFRLRSSDGWTSGIGSGQFSTRLIDTTTNSHKIWFEANEVYPSAVVLSFLDPANLLPDTFETMNFDVTVSFDTPWDRFAIERKRPQVTKIKLDDLQAKWGDLDLRAAGTLTVDAKGIPDGEITIKAKNWREMLRIAINTGTVPENAEMIVTRSLEVLSQMSGNPKTLDAPLSFSKGQIYLGILPIGPAPRIVIR